MKIWLNEQDLIDAACVYVSEQYQEHPNKLQAELQYDPSQGISAQVSTRTEASSMFHLQEQDLIDSAALYLASHHHFPPDRLTIELLFDENNGFAAEIHVY